MSARYVSLFMAILCIAAWSCKKQQPQRGPTGDYFIYGHAGGYTSPDYHTAYYLVNNGKLLKDVSQLAQAPPASIELFRFTEVCPATQYNSVADLPSSIPQELLQQSDATIGASLPDAGYSDIRARINGVTYKWVFEANLDSVASPIREFYNRCNISFR